MKEHERAEYRAIRKPRWREYTLVKHNGKIEISREKIWIDESKIFPSEEDFLWETGIDKGVEKVEKKGCI